MITLFCPKTTPERATKILDTVSKIPGVRALFLLDRDDSEYPGIPDRWLCIGGDIDFWAKSIRPNDIKAVVLGG